jgi:hypothetical protein
MEFSRKSKLIPVLQQNKACSILHFHNSSCSQVAKMSQGKRCEMTSEFVTVTKADLHEEPEDSTDEHEDDYDEESSSDDQASDEEQEVVRDCKEQVKDNSIKSTAIKCFNNIRAVKLDQVKTVVQVTRLLG